MDPDSARGGGCRHADRGPNVYAKGVAAVAVVTAVAVTAAAVMAVVVMAAAVTAAAVTADTTVAAATITAGTTTAATAMATTRTVSALAWASATASAPATAVTAATGTQAATTATAPTTSTTTTASNRLPAMPLDGGSRRRPARRRQPDRRRRALQRASRLAHTSGSTAARPRRPAVAASSCLPASPPARLTTSNPRSGSKTARSSISSRRSRAGRRATNGRFPDRACRRCPSRSPCRPTALISRGLHPFEKRARGQNGPQPAFPRPRFLSVADADIRVDAFEHKVGFLVAHVVEAVEEVAAWRRCRQNRGSPRPWPRHPRPGAVLGEVCETRWISPCSARGRSTQPANSRRSPSAWRASVGRSDRRHRPRPARS